MKRIQFGFLFFAFVFLNILGCINIKEITRNNFNPDFRWKNLSKYESQLDSSMIRVFWFNEKTIFPDKYELYAKSLLELGKNPGLGIHNIHKKEITGKGVSVAIIDMNKLFLDHPEFVGKDIEYYNHGIPNRSTNSIHGPGITSLLISDSIGTAPNVKLYYVGVPASTDAQIMADALNWLIEKNNSLPDNEKIRAVSVSAAPSGPESFCTKNTCKWDSAVRKAESVGIIVIDCTIDHGITEPCYYDINDPDNISKCTIGFLGLRQKSNTNKIYVPVGLRTVAEQYYKGEYSYLYTGRGGMSWTTPYLVGVLALGWQLRPDISGKEMLKILFNSSYNMNGVHIIQPLIFIDSVKMYN